MKEPNNPFTHIFSARGVECEKGSHKIGPFFELGCGHCLCQNCVLVSSRECPLCKWVPHQTITSMFTKYFPNLHIPESATVYIPTPRNEMFNAFGFYLGASLSIEMCALFLNGALCHNTALKSIESVFESIGEHVPDQFIENIVLDVHYRSLSVAKTVQYETTSTTPVGDFSELVKTAVKCGTRKAFVLAKNAINVSVLVDGQEIHIFDPFGTGRSRLPYIATFKSSDDCLPYLRTRLRNGGQPDFVNCQHTAELDVFEIAKLPSPQVRTVLTPPPPVELQTANNDIEQLPPPPDAILTAINQVRKAAGVASLSVPPVRKAPSMSPPVSNQPKIEPAEPTYQKPTIISTERVLLDDYKSTREAPLKSDTLLQEAMIGVPEVPWLSDNICRVLFSQLDSGLKRIAREEENLRTQLTDWESCSSRTVKCAGYLCSKRPDDTMSNNNSLLGEQNAYFGKTILSGAWSESATKSHLLECIELHTARKIQQQKEEEELYQIQKNIAKQASLLVAEGEQSMLADTAPIALDFSGISSVNFLNNQSNSHLSSLVDESIPMLPETSVNLLFITNLNQIQFDEISTEESSERKITVATEITSRDALSNWERIKRCIVVTPSSQSSAVRRN